MKTLCHALSHARLSRAHTQAIPRPYPGHSAIGAPRAVWDRAQPCGLQIRAHAHTPHATRTHGRTHVQAHSREEGGTYTYTHTYTPGTCTPGTCTPDTCTHQAHAHAHLRYMHTHTMHMHTSGTCTRRRWCTATSSRRTSCTQTPRTPPPYGSLTSAWYVPQPLL